LRTAAFDPDRDDDAIGGDFDLGITGDSEPVLGNLGTERENGKDREKYTHILHVTLKR